MREKSCSREIERTIWIIQIENLSCRTFENELSSSKMCFQFMESKKDVPLNANSFLISRLMLIIVGVPHASVPRLRVFWICFYLNFGTRFNWTNKLLSVWFSVVNPQIKVKNLFKRSACDASMHRIDDNFVTHTRRNRCIRRITTSAACIGMPHAVMHQH